jgi:tetratricopeptide (TPR) repeat protein
MAEEQTVQPEATEAHQERLDPATRARREAALRHVRMYGDPVLRSRARQIEVFDAALADEVQRMGALMDDALGIGLAATQLGVMHRLLVYRVDPDYPVAHQRLGLVHNAARRFDEAASSFKRALQKRPEDALALEGLAEAYLGLRDYNSAADTAAHAARLRPDSADAHYLAGLAHASLGQRDAALNDLSKLQQLKADAPAKLLSDFIEKKAPGKK